LAKEYKSNLLKRTITGLIIAIPLVCIVVLENYWVLIALLSFISMAGFYEWIKNGFRHPMLWGFSLIFIYFWFSICFMVGVLSIPSSMFIKVYALHEVSPVSVYFMIISIIINTAFFDIFAYIIGSNFGKRHIAPTISPNKTFEGLIGGLLANLFFGLLISHLFNISYWFLLICLFGGLLAFYGDLLISFHKRDKSLKDTGKILPGHGGVLDRIDSHLLATPIMLLFFILIVIL
jgi:phosphatidate cytidylyltransferase